jgi:hypothetical protein
MDANRGSTMSKSLLPVAVPGAIGCGLAGYAYLADRTGVTGTEGALLALIGALAVTLGCLVAGLTQRRGAVFGVLAGLIGLGAVLTAVAGVFLMQYGLAAAMALSFVGLVFVLLRPADGRRAV